MAIKNIPLRLLEVNRANDRHGELENETAAFAWLFKEREQHMRNLTKDIVDQGQIFEPPLVSPENGRFLVFDGNRRVTCLKLLSEPRRAPTTELQEFFQGQRDSWNGDFPEVFKCQVETDRDRIDEILFRRHTGTQNGVGQSTWDDRMKATFVARTGKGGGPSVADEIEKRLAEAHLLPTRRKIPRSTLNRLLSAEPYRNRVGISMRGGQFQYTHDENETLAALAKIASDLAARDVVLGDLWDVQGKEEYLAKLQSGGFLPKNPSPIMAEDSGTNQQKPRPKPTARAKPSTRTTLIPQKDFGFTWPGRLQRHHQIWEELQFHLDLRKHANAISVLLRVLIELSIENYAKQAGLTFYENEKLASKIQKVAEKLHDEGKVDKKQMDIINKFRQGEKIISADTLNKYVHSPNFAPSPEHLMSMWDSLADIVVLCLKV